MFKFAILLITHTCAHLMTHSIRGLSVNNNTACILSTLLFYDLDLSASINCSLAFAPVCAYWQTGIESKWIRIISAACLACLACMYAGDNISKGWRVIVSKFTCAVQMLWVCKLVRCVMFINDLCISVGSSFVQKNKFPLWEHNRLHI